MLEIHNVFDAALISAHTGKNPHILVIPHPTGGGCKVLFGFQGLPENYQHENLKVARNLLQKFDELNRLGIVTQKAFKEVEANRG